ncbi:unnamed protein product [Rotaria sordida]|uniref:Cysteine--tRNA ligase, cytoplasmic n=1 Tax=Rotaria sordida TaxID=392033 RepID=A0A819SSK6_9BILA|nr:unnamed protein product [Rotaria sordida]CAF4066796.1 unnamed protein product [Rotaria sordida]
MFAPLIDQHQQQSSSSNLQCRERSSEERLHLYNNLTKKKELFVPINGNEVRWHSCGPSFYGKIHMDVVRYYITSDILRRVMQNYFGYDVVYYMNIHDVDEKIADLADEKNSKTKNNMNIGSACEASTSLLKQSTNSNYDLPKPSKSFNSVMKYNDTDRKLSQDMFNKLFEDLNILTSSFGSFTSLTSIMSGTIFDIFTSFNLNSVHHDSDTDQLQSFNNNIVSALCNDIDLSGAMQWIISLIDITTEYINGEKIHVKLVQNVYDKIINLLKIFGLNYPDVFYCKKNLDDDK